MSMVPKKYAYVTPCEPVVMHVALCDYYTHVVGPRLRAGRSMVFGTQRPDHSTALRCYVMDDDVIHLRPVRSAALRYCVTGSRWSKVWYT